MAAAPDDDAAGGSSSRLRLRVVDTALVTPAGPALPPLSLPLTFFDVKWLHLPPVERVFFYRLSSPEAANVDTILAAFKDSLSQALRVFYPLAGHIVLPVASRHELVYRPGDAVPFTTAEYDLDMDDLVSYDDPVSVRRLAPLVPQLPKGRAVLAVQATLLLRRRSLALGVTVHHSACDGASSTHFLHTWAAAARAGAPPPPPPVIVDRIPDSRGLYDIYLKSLPPIISDEAFEFVSKPPSSFEDRLLATFTLPRSLQESIKGVVASEAARRGITPPRCSSMLATYAFIWSCYCRSRSGSGSKTTSYFLFSVDHRARLMKSAVPATYFGNCLCPAIATAPEEEVAAAGIAGLLAACAAVAAALEEEVREGAQDTWHACVDRVKQAVASGSLLSVAGSPRFRVYDVDFGLGRPAKVEMVSAAKSGAMPISEARVGGGVEVGVSLTAADGAMERFQKSFADGIACLSLCD